MEVLHGIFAIFKFIFGLGALGALIGIGLGLLWFFLRVIVQRQLAAQPQGQQFGLRKLFLES